MSDDKATALSVSAVAVFLYNVISENISKLWIRGEVSNLKIQKNGNVYFSLKDEQSKLNCVIMHFSEARKDCETLKDGQEILVYGKVSYYKKEGYISVFIDKWETIGQGLLQQRFEELKRKLAAEGLFDRERKKTIPEFPQTVGIVTSPSGAAIQDILNVTRRRFQSVNIVVFPAAVQGDGAAEEITRAIRVANRYPHIIDVLIVGRGGGSLEDLWCFNEETVARAIAASQIPVISAVGHEIDFTIADFVADLRAPTPSAAAELVVKDRGEMLNYIGNLRNRLELQVENRVENIRLILDAKGSHYLKKTMQAKVADISMILDNLQIRFDAVFKNNLQNLHSRIRLQDEKLRALNPLNILSRGYSITYKINPDGTKTGVSDSRKVKKGDRLHTRLHQGEIESTAD